MAKPGTKKQPSSSSIEFFKVFLSNSSSHQLSFPPAFVMRLNGKSAPENVTLKDHTGNIWDVQLVKKTERRLIIEQGWKEFANHHSLVDGDFLIFKYDMNSQFFVKVFDRNGLKKKKIVTKNDSSDRIHVKEETGIETENEKATSGSKRKCSEMESNPTKRSAGRPRGSLSKRTKLSVRKTTATKRGRPGSPKNAKKPHYVKPKNPYFEYVHRSVLNEHKLILQENVRLRDENGMLWPVTVCFRADGRIIINNGWLEFHRMHKVALRDTCVFEFIPTEDNIVKIIQVHIVPKLVKPKKKNA